MGPRWRKRDLGCSGMRAFIVLDTEPSDRDNDALAIMQAYQVNGTWTLPDEYSN